MKEIICPLLPLQSNWIYWIALLPPPVEYLLPSGRVHSFGYLQTKLPAIAGAVVAKNIMVAIMIVLFILSILSL